ncbi:ATP-dependent RNA helicase dbp6 [Scheffersomyces spartinae]|uniref:RNA helicase n=1 Tax=Scheffersomyces spartinae TaxID=45513 RepID=A0A9P7VDG8_9ASCO|nr:ATP-dependent RNA helicase dbp6 [Scheffersomyces spartinae]KAG7195687.1 ATP-dependent RNA helicase dbp6 [Scheffersomyces spartinae]
MFAGRFDPSAFSGTKRKRDSDNYESDVSDDLSINESGVDDSGSEEEDSTSENTKKEEFSSDSESDSESDSDRGSDNESNSSISDKETDVNAMDIDSGNSKSSIEELAGEGDEAYVDKHHSVFLKFQKSIDKSIQSTNLNGEEDVSDDNIVQQDLQPLPQPPLPRDRRLKATTTHLKSLDWLAVPTYTAPEITEPFSGFPLNPKLQSNLNSLGYTSAFAVQISVLHVLLSDIRKNIFQPDHRGDLLVNALTGSGKTLAYLIPIIEALHKRTVPKVRAIILVPTKPLINQVKQTLDTLRKGTKLHVVSLKNDISLKEEARKLLSNVPDIIVTTPGRLVDHLTMESINLQDLRYLVIDEADRLLNQSFQNWCSVVISKLCPVGAVDNKWNRTPQKLIFSATLTTDAGKLTQLKLHNPRLIIVNKEHQLLQNDELFSVPATLNEFLIQVGTAKASVKPLLLAKLLLTQKRHRNVLIFAKSNEATIRLAKLLQSLFDRLVSLHDEKPLVVEYLNSTNNTSQIRKQILNKFHEGSINVLVATDLIARGIDILSITTVVNYDLPNSAREYVHRVGRTARANKTGDAISIVVGKGEQKWFNKLTKEIGRSPEQSIGIIEGVITEQLEEQIYTQCLEQLQKQIAR